MIRSLNCVVMSLLLIASIALPASAATEGRLAGLVVDPEGNPLEGVQILVKALDFDFETSRTTNKKGKFTLLLLDATKSYSIRFEKEGFVSLEEPLDPKLGETVRKTWTLMPGTGSRGGGPAPAAGVAPSAEAGKGRAAKLYEEGYEALQAKDLEKAQSSFEKVIELQPDLPEAHTALALVYMEKQAFAEALAEADRVLQLRPDDVMARKVQFEAYRGLGNREKEEEILEILMATAPDAELARLVFNSGVARVQQGDMAGAAERFEEARQMDPELLPAYSALTRVYFDLGRYDDAVEVAGQYLEKDPQSGEVLGVLYLIYEQQGKQAEAEETFQRLKVANPGQIVEVFEQLGVAHFNNGETDKAMTLFERVLEAQPDHARAHYHLALCYLNMGDTGKAKELLSRFVELAPNDPEAAVAREMLASL